MATYKTSDFRKGIKVQIDGDPYVMVEMNFVKPGKGIALYKCRLKNLIRGNVRVPDQLEGDIRAFIAALELTEARLAAFLQPLQGLRLEGVAHEVDGAEVQQHADGTLG